MALLIDWTSDNAYTNPFLMGQLVFKRHEQCFVCLVLANVCTYRFVSDLDTKLMM